MPDSFRSLVPVAKEPVTPIDLLESRELSPEMMAYLWLAVENKMSILFCGPKDLEKTRYLDLLSFFIPREAGVTSISVGHEWGIPHDNWLGLKLNSTDEMPPHIWGSEAKKSDYLMIERLERIGLAMAPFPMAGGKSVCSTVDFTDADDFVNTVTGPNPLMHKVQLTALNIIATVRGITEEDSVENRHKTGNPLSQKVTSITEMVGYDQNVDKVIVNEPYWWERKGKPAAPQHFDWYFFSGHSFLYEMLMENRKLTSAEMEAEILRRTNFLRWLFHKKTTNPADIIKEMAAFSREPSSVGQRCADELKDIVLPVDGRTHDGTPLPRTKAKLRGI